MPRKQQQADLVTCPGCGLLYVTGIDDREHERCHAGWEEAEARFGRIRPHSEREEAKRAAWETASSGAPLEERVAAGIDIIRTHFERSVSQGSFCVVGRHPDFETYAAAYENDSLKLIEDVWQEIVRRYPRAPAPNMKPGYTTWDTTRRSATPRRRR